MSTSTGRNLSPTRDAVVQQPRPFGYVVGDLIEQRVLLQSGVRPLETPPTGRVSIWLERRPATVVADSEGRHWLVVDYQLINAPQGLTTVNLPEWSLGSSAGGEILRVPPWPISVGPLTLRAVVAQGGLQELRADRPAPMIPTAPLMRQIEIGCGALILTLLAWAFWVAWRNWRAASNHPFARAARDMRGLDNSSPDAWRALHRAFDRTAGRVVQTATLPELFEEARQLEPLRGRIEEFFTQSAEIFFAGAVPASTLSVQALCGELLRIERQSEK